VYSEPEKGGRGKRARLESSRKPQGFQRVVFGGPVKSRAYPWTPHMLFAKAPGGSMQAEALGLRQGHQLD